MSATTAAAVKAYLEGKGLGISVYKDVAPAEVRDKATSRIKAPYCTVIGGLGGAMDPLEDGGPANGGIATGVELVQLDLWQNWLGTDGKVTESATLPDQICEAIHGARLPTAPKTVYHVGLRGLPVRLVERDSNLIHHAFTLEVHRVI